MQGTQAKMVSLTQERTMLGYLDTTRSPTRNRVMLLLSMQAGLCAKAIALLTWAMVTDATGQVGKTIHLEHRASKGKTGGHTMLMHPDVQATLATLQTALRPDQSVLFSERGGRLSPATVDL